MIRIVFDCYLIVSVLMLESFIQHILAAIYVYELRIGAM